MGKSVVIIGGGIAGMEAAASLSGMGADVTIIEKNDRLGGHLRDWAHLFPSRRPAGEVYDFLEKEITDKISVRLNTRISKIKRDEHNIFTILESGESLKSDALLLTMGYQLFDAAKKEEYGYGIYENVITSAELEGIFKTGKGITTSAGARPKRIGIVHCVGSRDEKVGNLYCSKVCCITGVKQAIEIKQQLPECDIFSFYMDLRMFDRHFEELYFEAQAKWNIHFIRGRLSESCENPDHSILVKVEDTLTGKPLKMTVDLLVLLVGFMPSSATRDLAGMIDIKPGEDGFLVPLDEHFKPNSTNVPGVFLAGTVKGPATIENTITDARAAALQIIAYLESGIRHPASTSK
jgi:heterodisulfide reductase subunit A2